MKTNIPGIAVFLLVILAIAGCKKDSKNETAKNSLKVDGTEYEVSKGILVNYGAIKTSVYDFSLILLSPGLTVYETAGLPDSIAGTGHYIAFEILSSDAAKLSAGDYPFNNSELAGSFYYGGYLTNWNSATSQPDLVGLISGSLKVINNGAEYELSFTGKDFNNKSVTGYYKGSLRYYADYKKSPKHIRGSFSKN